VYDDSMGLIGTLFTAVTGIPGAADRALLDALCLACVADGTPSEIERGHALGIALELPGFQRVSEAKLAAQIDEALAAMARDGDRRATMARIAKALPGEAREQAFALAAVIVAVDLDVHDVEHGFLVALRGALHLGEARAAAIQADINRELDAIRAGDAPLPGS
jgi:hypothetical protein